MKKIEKKILVVKQMLNACITSSGVEAFGYGNIPEKRFLGAKKRYAFDAQYDDVLALIDTTILGTGERGMLITTHDMYLKERLSPPIHGKLSDINGFVLPTEIYYDVGNLISMLLKLQEIENQPENEIWNGIGNIVGSILQEGVKAIKEEYHKQVSAVEQESLEILEDVRETLIIIRDDILGSLIEEYDGSSLMVAILQIIHIAAISYLFVNSYEKYEKIWIDEICEDGEELEEAELAKQIVELMPQIVENFNEVIDDLYEENIEPIDRTFKRFNSTMVRIYEEMKDDVENDNIIKENIENYFYESQNAIKTFKRKINIILKFLNRKIEDAYNND